MPRFNFDIHENGRLIPDDDRRDEDARKEAVLTRASIARDAFAAGSAHRVVVDVREEGAPPLKVSITLEVEEA
ncbi:DUF6894 family protein [Bradyrhizobium sp. Arg816]|uniref:DUF6894 family protein n=1 Tax=Bradyrhizobium sp. Arg816 TaxID=2998491 RepID=UPI00249EAC2D|nr:hypothetical protein [Bradyrhizobium sp. Arg816]MDI3558944.1 hypothetical protein [Bradyrhizobium sp. Arg816]